MIFKNSTIGRSTRLHIFIIITFFYQHSKKLNIKKYSNLKDFKKVIFETNLFFKIVFISFKNKSLLYFHLNHIWKGL